jgi:uncharacterized protein
VDTKASGVGAGQRRLNGIQTSGREYRNLSDPQHEMEQVDDVAIAMRDGVTLLADVYRPTTDGRYPALLSFAAYPRQIQNLRLPLGMVEAGASDFFVPRGYVHVIVNARGIAGSEGKWGLLDAQERGDLYDVIEWIAAQPWCDGKVGMLGISYFAMAQMAAAVAKPPSLKAIFALGTNESVFDVVSHHGVVSSSFLSAWFGAVGILSGKSDELWRSRRLELVRALMSESRVHARLADINGEALVGALKHVVRGHYPDDPFARLWEQVTIEHPVYDEFWAERDSHAALADVDIPVYLGCDWDNVVMHLPGTFTSWNALAHNPNVRMAMLPEGGLNWPWESMHYEALAWYDHWFKGADTGIMDGPPIRYNLPGTDEWRTAATWPPEQSRLVEYALCADGTLSPNESAAGAREYLYLPESLEPPIHAGSSKLPGALTWDSDPLDDSVSVAGDLELVLDASITAFDTSWIALLYDVPPSGSPVPITGGWLRASLRTVDEEASRPGRPVVRCLRPKPVSGGETVRYRIPLVPNARHLPADHRLRLVLTSCDRREGGPTILGFTHTEVGEASINTIRSSSRLLVPLVG